MENLLKKESVVRVTKVLHEFDTDLEVKILNSSARTALDAATSLNCEVGAIVKSLLFKTENTYTLCLVAGDRKASLNKIKKNLSQKYLYKLILEMKSKKTVFNVKN